jgi:hypothetical protein
VWVSAPLSAHSTAMDLSRNKPVSTLMAPGTRKGRRVPRQFPLSAMSEPSAQAELRSPYKISAVPSVVRIRLGGLSGWVPCGEYHRLRAELGSITELLAAISQENHAARLSLEAKRDELRQELAVWSASASYSPL